MRAPTRAAAGLLWLLLALSPPACNREPTVQPIAPARASIATETLPPPAVSTQVAIPTPRPTPEPTSDFLVARSASCAQAGNMRSIAALDALTVRFSLCAPDAAFPAKAALPVFGIQPRSWIESTDGTGEILAHPIGTGPWQLQQWLRGEALHFTRFEDYWGARAPFSELIFRWEAEAEARLAELRSGAVDAITHVRAADYQVVQQDGSLTLIPVQSTNTLYLGMNSAFNPFDDTRVRRAVAQGIDRQAIVSGFYPAGSEVATHFTPCSIPNGCTGADWAEFDLPAARALLAAAGYPHGFESALYYHDVYRLYLPEPGQVAEELQLQLRENLGIEVTVILMDSTSFIRQATGGELAGFHLLGWGADFAHVNSVLDFHFGQHSRQFGSAHLELQDLLLQASGMADLSTAATLYARANDAISTLVPAIPIAHGATAYAARVGVANLHVPPLGAPQFHLSDSGSDRLVFMQNAEPLSLYCADETDLESMAACQQVLQGLFGYAPASARIEPRLAEECTPDEDADEWVCRLRAGVRFHDGSRLHANDVVASWAAALDAASPYHTGNTGAFIYPQWLWGGLMNSPER
ncbi:MAG: ABC transporter substrate-binding protein [Anaerolineales bacterium]|jgi:ABC-type transport system substrate-binding protein|nr:ABC transporter substrate-binding protein [Anaerolineales bacterium]HJN41266.1 ABC transporter substrate-binding protein [Anaerolineales bacterium]|tara:strand:+ start:2052 stop:3797 length:1746 start_codon:yes stop_codon:yes gene_type:complete